MKHSLVFAIDGGGTKSRIALALSDGTVLCRQEGSTTNIYAMNKDELSSALKALIAGACMSCGYGLEAIKAGCIGSAGLSRPKEYERFRLVFDDILGSDIPVRMCNDAEILLVGGLGSTQGLCLIAGTGSIALGRLSCGRMERSGGMGWRLGDEGSAWWIAQQAVVRTLRSLEQRDLPTTMADALLDAFAVQEPSQLIPLFNGLSLSKADIAAAAPIVTRAARGGDVLALDILGQAARELVLLVRSVLIRMPELAGCQMVCAGGVFDHDEIVMECFQAELGKAGLDIERVVPRGTALDGAVKLALEGV